jgi:hypothetical protein
MGLPPVALEWQWDVNNDVPLQANASAQAAEVALAAFAALTGFAHHAWQVKGSSNGTTAAMDGSNRLLVAADIVAAAGAHSWIVMRNPVTGIEFCIDWNSATGKYVSTRVFSANAGFTGGTTTARPTATDESVIESAGAWFPSTAGRQQVHVLHSMDGTVTYVFTLYRGAVIGFWMLGAVGDPVDGWTLPYMGIIDGKSALDTTSYLWSFLHAASTSVIRARAPAGNMTLCLTQEGTGGNVLQEIAAYREDESNQAFLIMEQGLMSYTASCRGRHGEVIDMWRTNTGVPSGTLFCGLGYQLAVLGGWVVPWPDDTPVLVM